MTNRKDYDLKSRLRQEHYNALIDYAAEYCTKCSFVVQPQLLSNEKMQSFMYNMEQYLLSRFESDVWPGTNIFGKALVYVYSYEPHVITILKNVSRGFVDWQQPNNPEDMAIYRPDGSVWLGSIAHERVAWLSLSDDELGILHYSLPELYRLLSKRGTKGTNIYLGDNGIFYFK